jgi:carbon monoxide dehydrogenase subunit G
MRGFLKFVVVVLMIMVCLTGFVALRPSHFEVTRTTTIAAPPAAVFAHVDDLHKWKAWSPWEKMDPNATETHEGPEAGKGAKMSWDSKKNEVGAGSMTIVDDKSPESVTLKLEFKRPMEGVADSFFTFTPVEDGKTKVTWKTSGENGFVGKAYGLIVDFDKMMGSEFEKGLAEMKNVVEAEAAKKTP